MRLLLLASEFPPGPGGIGNHAHQLALHLRRLGWDLAVVSPQDYVTAAEAEAFNAAQDFRVVRLSSGGGRWREALRRFKVIDQLIKGWRPDLLLGSGLSGVWLAALVRRLRSLPMVAVAHGSEFGRGVGFTGLANRWAYGGADVVLAVSRFTKGVVDRAGIRPRQLEVIPNAADPGQFRLLTKAECDAFRRGAGFDEQLLLLTIGHVSERKGQEVVVRAMPEILKRVPGAHYVMIGLPTLKPQLSQLAADLGVSGHVHFLGRVGEEDKLRWLNCCDLFLMTSRTTAGGDCEGFGIAVVEAALCEKPAVVADGSGIVEAIEHGTTGWAVRENDPHAVAEAVIGLLTDPGRRLELGQGARARALREQTWDVCAQRYDAFLRGLINRAGT